MCVESSSDDERQSNTEDSRMVENFDNFDVKEIKVEDEVRKQDHGKHMLEACSGEKLDEKSDDLYSHPVFESPLKGFSAEHLLNIIVGKDVPENKLCKSIPRAIRKHATFVVDTTFMDSSDIIGYGDDNGSWKGHTKPRRKYAIEVCDVTDTLLVEENKPSVKTAQRHEFYDILELLNEGTFVRAISFAKSSSASTNST